MSCINTSSLQYKKLLKESEETWKDPLDLYLQVSRFNNYFDRFPNSLSELDKGLEFIDYKDLMLEDISRIVQINSPSVTQSEDNVNVYEFRVVAESKMINTREQAYKLAERLANQINDEFVSPSQKNIARVSSDTGIVKLTIEPNSPVINSYIQTSYIQTEKQKREYEEEVLSEVQETETEYNPLDYKAYEDFNKLLESGEITQTCKI